MTLNQMKYFVTLAECLSYTEAAKCLFISQPALSRQIISMEEELGTQLLARDRKNLKLTPGGLVLYQRFTAIMEAYQDAVQDARTANLGYEGSLSIGFLDVYDISTLFSDVIREFQDQYQNINLSLERYSLGELPQLLQNQQLDMVLTYGFSLFDQPELMTVNVQKFQSCIMIPKSHPLAQKEGLCLEDLAGDTFIQLGPSVCQEGHSFIENMLAKANVHPRMVTAKKMEDVLLWVQTGNAVSITTDCTIEKQNPYVVIKPLAMEEAKGHDVTMAWKKSNYNPAIAIFMELLEKRL